MLTVFGETLLGTNSVFAHALGSHGKVTLREAHPALN
jgi:hypothetical protein